MQSPADPWVGLVLHPDYVHGQAAVEVARLAEDRGFHSIWAPETWGRDNFTYLTQLALSTSRIALASGISPIFSRTPALLAQTAASLDEISQGRFILGVGASGPKVVEGWHGQPYSQPLLRTRECVSIVRLALAGGRVDFEGRLFSVHGFALGFRPHRKSVPIYLAGLGERNIRLAGEIADGWLPIFLSLDRLEYFKGLLDEGCAIAGRPPGSVSIAAFVPTCVSGDAVRDERLIRSHLAYYLGGMGDFYNQLVASYGFQEEAGEIKALWRAGNREGAASAVTNAMLDELAIYGTPEVARARVRAFLNAGVSPILACPQGASANDLVQTIDALAAAPA